MSACCYGEYALGINDLGHIVGRSNTVGPMLWANPAATPVELDALGNGAASGINNTGVIVGATTYGPHIWTPVQTADLFLHAKGQKLYVDSNAPTKADVAYRDSPALSFAGGNPWKTIGTWTQSPAGGTRTVVSLGPMQVLIGLRNSSDKGTWFDMRADLLKNGVSIQSEEVDCIQGATRDPRNAVGFNVLAPSPRLIDEVDLAPTDTLSVRMSARIGTDGTAGFCGGQADATGVRLYFDGVDRQTQIAIDFQSR